VNRNATLTLFFSFLLAACTFDAPLAPDASMPIDPDLLGSWKFLPAPGEAPTSETVAVQADGANRYTIEYHDGDSVIYFSGWLGELEGTRFLQLKVTGDEDGPAAPDESNLYSVFAYDFIDGDLVVRALNTERVDPDLTSTSALQQAFVQHHDDPLLFSEPGRMRRL
jgi:hypothetical protein